MGGNQNSLPRDSQIHRSTVRSLTFLASWASKNNRLSLSTTKFNSCSIFTFISNGSAQVHLIDFWVTRKRHTRAQQRLWTAIYFSIIGGVARSQTKRCISTMKHAISLKLECGLALWQSLSTIHHSQFSENFLTESFPNPVTYKVISYHIIVNPD